MSKSSALARNRTFRCRRSARYASTSGSRYETWLLARITGPPTGMRSRPSIVHRMPEVQRRDTARQRATTYGAPRSVAYADPWFPTRPDSRAAGVVIPIRAFAVGKARLADDARRRRTGPSSRRADGRPGARRRRRRSRSSSCRRPTRGPQWAAGTASTVLDDPGDLDRRRRRRGRLVRRARARPGDRRPRRPPPRPARRAGAARRRRRASRSSPSSRATATTAPRCSRSRSHVGVPFAYGPGSFRRHVAAARAAGLARPGRRATRSSASTSTSRPTCSRSRSRRHRAPLIAIRRADPAPDLAPPGARARDRRPPDDIEFGCGGHARQVGGAGTEVHLLILTDGSKGTWDETDDLDALDRAPPARGTRGRAAAWAPRDGALRRSRRR